MRTPGAVVVLGCALRARGDGRLGGAAARRAAAGARVFAQRAGDRGLLVVASGGRRWRGVTEADGLARELTRLGVPDSVIVRERLSLSTRDNARYTAEVLRKRRIERILLVTCAWHLPRARALFAREGLFVEPVAAEDLSASLATRAWRWARERVAARLDGVAHAP